jgi:hypothetical protein
VLCLDWTCEASRDQPGKNYAATLFLSGTGVQHPRSQLLYWEIMTCSRCSGAEQIPGQRWCRRCLSAYAGERRARLRLEKRAPELLSVAREAVGQVRTMLQSLGAWSQPPQCCRDAHFRDHPCGCACHAARAWLESLPETLTFNSHADGR